MGTQAAFEGAGMKALRLLLPAARRGIPEGSRPRAPPPPSFPSPPRPPARRQPRQEEPHRRGQLQPLPPGHSRQEPGSPRGLRAPGCTSEPPAKGTERRMEPRGSRGLAGGRLGAGCRAPAGNSLGTSQLYQGRSPGTSKAGGGSGNRGRSLWSPPAPSSAAPRCSHRPDAGVRYRHTWVQGCDPPLPRLRCGTQPIAVATATSAGCIFCTGAAVGTWPGATSFRSGSLGRLCSRHRAQLAAASSPASPCPCVGHGPGREGGSGRGLHSDPRHGDAHPLPRTPWLWDGSSEGKRERPPRLPRARAVPAAPGATEPLPRHLGPQGNAPPPLPPAWPRQLPAGRRGTRRGGIAEQRSCSGRVWDSRVPSPLSPAREWLSPSVPQFPQREIPPQAKGLPRSPAQRSEAVGPGAA